ncbi:MAG TPA: phenylalanine--tRNA ligase beta subunit-related protein, partial [Thermoanaerobaculia bacterium]|nr:phenylalanine--tRNA ligase beta subunit-related protein [Thermoanaerobaculia bacterium]
LLRRVLKGEELPAIHPLVDLNNCLSVILGVPSCTAAEGTFDPPVTLRAGRDGESFESLRGPLGLAGKPLLADPAGPFGTPISDGERIRIRDETRRAWLALYLPRGAVSAETARETLEGLLAEAPVAMVELIAVS